MEERAGTFVKRVLIVDDHSLVRKALRELVQSQPDLEVCGETDNAPDALELVRSRRPELAIIDLSLRSGSGLDLIKRIRALDEQLKILVVSMHDESMFARRALAAGALGYVNKAEPEERFLWAIRGVLSGRVTLSGPVAQRILRRSVGSGPQPGPDLLSDREIEVLELIGRGFPTRRIAEHLKLSVKTIETYREKLKDKLRLADGAALARYAAVWAHEQTKP